MVLRASATPIDTAMPAVPKPAASEAAPASAVMTELSVARTVMPSAAMPTVPVLRSPLIEASTSTPIRFSDQTPEPAAPMPAVPEAPTATEPAKTSALMRWSAVACTLSSPTASTAVSDR